MRGRASGDRGGGVAAGRQSELGRGVSLGSSTRNRGIIRSSKWRQRHYSQRCLGCTAMASRVGGEKRRKGKQVGDDIVIKI